MKKRKNKTAWVGFKWKHYISFRDPLTITIRVKIIPGAKQNRIEDWKDDILRIRIQAAPDKGKANEALISFLSKTLNVAKSSIRIVSGLTARNKKIVVEGLTKEQFLIQVIPNAAQISGPFN